MTLNCLTTKVLHYGICALTSLTAQESDPKLIHYKFTHHSPDLISDVINLVEEYEKDKTYARKWHTILQKHYSLDLIMQIGNMHQWIAHDIKVNHPSIATIYTEGVTQTKHNSPIQLSLEESIMTDKEVARYYAMIHDPLKEDNLYHLLVPVVSSVNTRLLKRGYQVYVADGTYDASDTIQTQRDLENQSESLFDLRENEAIEKQKGAGTHKIEIALNRDRDPNSCLRLTEEARCCADRRLQVA